MSDFHLDVANGKNLDNKVWEGPLVTVDGPRFTAFVPGIAYQFDANFSQGPVDASAPFTALGMAQSIAPIPTTIL